MTARDEAIQAVADAAHEWRYGETAASIADNELCILSEAIVDAIPPNVLARLAIEQGALKDTTFAMTGQGTVYACTADWNPDDLGHHRLYRVVEP